MISYKQESLRKLIHLSSLWIPLLYYFTSKEITIVFLLPLFLLTLFFDLARRYNDQLNYFVNLCLGMVMRDNEKGGKALSGAFYMLLGALLTIVFFTKDIAIYSLTVLVFCDSAAALVGRKWGRVKIFDKTLEGSIAFFVSAIIIYFLMIVMLDFNLKFLQAIIAAMIGTIAELLSKELTLDDNFFIPITMGAFASFF